MLTKSIALELAPYQIRVNGIAPGITETDSSYSFIQQNPEGWQKRLKDIPLKRAGHPEDYAALALLLASDASSWITGVTIPCDGGQTIR